MTDYYDGQITDILPHNLKDDSAVEALSYALRECTRLMYDYAQRTEVYCNIDNLPEDILDLLAVELRTQYYDDEADIETKRTLVRNTLIWYMKAGTPEAVEELINVVFKEGYLEEWWEYDAEPYWFKIYTDSTLGKDELEYFSDLVKRIKNTRSHLGSIETLRQVFLNEYAGVGGISAYHTAIKEYVWPTWKYYAGAANIAEYRPAPIMENAKAFAVYNPNDKSITFCYSNPDLYSDGDNEIYYAEDWPTGGSYSVSAVPWYSHRQEIETIKNDGFEQYHGLTALKYFFYQFYNVTNIGALKWWDVSNVIYMDGMFRECSITNVDALANWKTSKLQSLGGTFRSADLINVDGLANWDTSNLTYISDLFYNCKDLENIDGLAKWDVSKVNQLGYAFRDCQNLKSIDVLQNWRLPNAYYFFDAFWGCEAIEDLDALKNWNIRSAENIYGLFAKCLNVKSIDLTSWSFSKVTTKGNALYDTASGSKSCIITCTQAVKDVLIEGTNITEDYFTWNII